MTCDRDFQTLSAWVDGELEDDEATRLEEHLESCETCRDVADTLGATRHRLAKLGARRAPTDATRHDLESRAEAFAAKSDDSTTSATPNRLRRTVAAVGALAVAVGLVVGGLVVGPDGVSTDDQETGEWAETFVSDHVRSRPAAKPMDVSSNDPATVQRFFAPKVSFQPVAPEVEGAELVGGRDCTLKGDRVQLLFYRVEDRILSLFVSDDLEAPATCRRREDHTVCVDDRGHLRLMMVGQEPADRLRGRLASIDL